MNKTNLLRASQSGSITIFLALCITIILSFIFGVLESARVTSIKAHAKSVSFMALDSSFAGYAKPLFEKYGIYGVFTTEENFLSRVKDYTETNINTDYNINFNLLKAKVGDVQYNTLYHLTDNDGLLFASQAISFEKYRGISEKISDLRDMEEKSGTDFTSSISQIENDEFVTDPNDISSLTELTHSSSDMYRDLSPSESESIKKGIVSKIVDFFKSKLLLFFIEDHNSISNLNIADEYFNEFPSNKCVLSEEATGIQNGTLTDTLTSVIDKALFVSYIDNSFNSYVSTDINPDISLNYQREYIIGGCNSDSDNLLQAAMQMVFIRAGFNLTYLLSNSEKRSYAVNLARNICFSEPITSAIVAFTILSAWSYAEGILDVRDLFSGKKVPMMKDDNTWTLSLNGILGLTRDTPSNNTDEDGLTYDEYIDIILMFSDPFVTYFRTMDLIQLDMCENINAEFRMYSCICGASINFDFNATPLFTRALNVFSPELYNYNFSTVYGYD